MTEAEILQAIDYMVQCLPEDRELLIDSIWNSGEIRELIIETARDTIETVLEKLQIALQKVAEREPRIIELKFDETIFAPLLSGEIVVTKSRT